MLTALEHLNTISGRRELVHSGKNTFFFFNLEMLLIQLIEKKKKKAKQTGSVIVFNWVSTQQDLYFPKLVLCDLW